MKKDDEKSDALVAFWKAEYCSLARAGVEKMAELGAEVDPAVKTSSEQAH